MKNIICVLLLCIGFTAATAQEVYNSSGKQAYHRKTKKSKGYDPDKLIVGGSLNAGFASGYTNLGIAPILGYRLTNRFSAGIGLGYQYYKAPDYSGVYDPQNPDRVLSVTENIIYPSIWARYFVFRNIFIDANLEYDFISVKQYDDYYDVNQNNYVLVQDKITTDVPCLLLGVGFKQPLGGRVSFFGEIMYDVLQQEYSPYYGQPVFRAGIAAGF